MARADTSNGKTNSHRNPTDALARGDAAHAMQLFYAPVREELEEVERRLDEVFRHEHPFIDALLKHGSLLAGKRMRPALLLLVAKACGRVDPRHLTLAVALEMIHTATLVHDDVLDEADMRRHVRTIHRRWNLESSVLFGDFLFTQAFYLVGDKVGDGACGRVASITNQVCEGELKQIASRGEFELSQDGYFEIIEAKTAALCRCAGEFGAKFAGAEMRIVQRMADFGTHLGLAFQIVDDILDLVGSESTTGKSLGRDLELNKATLPLILAREAADLDSRARLESLFQQGDEAAAEIQALVEQLGGIDAGREVARSQAEQALTCLEGLEESPAEQTLRQLCRFVVDRGF